MRSYSILIVDDNEYEFLVMQQGFKELKSKHELNYAEDGQTMLEHLANCRKPGSKLPDLIIMDINMPHINGIEALRLVKNNSHYAHIPVIMHSTSQYHTDREVCMSLGASDFVTKKFETKEISSFVRNIDDFLLNLAKAGNARSLTIPSIPN